MDVTRFSNRFFVRSMTDDDIPLIYELCKHNVLYYEYCSPFVTRQSAAFRQKRR